MIRDILNLLRKNNLQAQALQECHEMLSLCETMVAASVESLRRRDDAKIDIDIRAMDRKLNAFERDVRRKVMTHLALGHTGDLSAGLVLISIVIDLERIGDYSKNIYDLAIQHPTRLNGGPIEAPLAQIENDTLALLSLASKAFRTGDHDAARQLMRDYKADISAKCHELEKGLVTGETVVDGMTGASLALYMRFLKRISAHSRNLASSVINPFDRIGYPE